MIEEYCKIIDKTHYVYHYTSFETLFALLEGARKENDNHFQFRASNIYKVNDPKEMEAGFNVVKRLLAQHEIIKGFPEWLKLSEVFNNSQHEEHCKQDYLFGRNKDMIQTGIIPYVISFSKLRDFLPMWTLYGKKGNGVCLKMEVSSLLDIWPFPTLGFVTYNGKTNMETSDSIMSQMLDLYKNQYTKDEAVSPSIYDKIRELATICLIISPFVKYKDYQYEKEFRIIFEKRYGPDVTKISRCYSEKWYMVEPYITIKIPINALKEIIIGPNANYEVMKEVLTLEMKECDINPRIISHSKIAFTSAK